MVPPDASFGVSLAALAVAGSSLAWQARREQRQQAARVHVSPHTEWPSEREGYKASVVVDNGSDSPIHEVWVALKDDGPWWTALGGSRPLAWCDCRRVI